MKEDYKPPRRVAISTMSRAELAIHRAAAELERLVAGALDHPLRRALADLKHSREEVADYLDDPKTDAKAKGYFDLPPLRLEYIPLKMEDMPEPDAYVVRDDGTKAMAMFHYMPSEVPFKKVAEELGFESVFVHMDTDLGEEHELFRDYQSSGDRWRSEWSPTAGGGYKVAIIEDTDDGPMAMFVRRAQIFPN